MLKLKPRRYRNADGSTTVVYFYAGRCEVTGELVKRTSTHCHTESEAQIVLDRVKEQRRKIAVLGEQAICTFGDAVEEYLAKGGEARYLEPLNNEFGDTLLSAITDTMLTSGATKYYPKAGVNTLRRQWYDPFQWVWNAAARARMCQHHQWARPRKRKVTIKAPPDGWLEAVMRSCTTLEQRAIVVFMSFTAARVSEAINVRLCDYDFDRGTVTIRVKAKRGDEQHERVCYLPDFVNEAMKLVREAIYKNAKDKPVSPATRLFGFTSRHSVNQFLERAVDRLNVQAGVLKIDRPRKGKVVKTWISDPVVGYYSPHKAGRHAFAKRFLADGHSLRALMEAGGWGAEAVHRYAEYERKHIENAMREASTTPELARSLLGEASTVNSTVLIEQPSTTRKTA